MKTKSYPWNWTREDAYANYDSYLEWCFNGFELGFSDWLEKHRQLEFASNSASGPFCEQGIKKLESELHI